MPDVDFKIDAATGDLSFTGDSIDCVAGIELTQQRIVIGLKTFLGEWFADESQGTRWWQDVFTDQPKTNLVEGMLRSRILDDEDIEALTSFTMTVDSRARQLSVNFVAKSIYGVIQASAVLP